jgi:4,5-dihydroxyphthalate decarboxylase
MNISLSIAMASNPRTWPILDGRAKPDGIALVPSVVHPSELFWRQLRFGDFDVSEMSFSSLMMATSKGDDRWAACRFSRPGNSSTRKSS